MISDRNELKNSVWKNGNNPTEETVSFKEHYYQIQYNSDTRSFSFISIYKIDFSKEKKEVYISFIFSQFLLEI